MRWASSPRRTEGNQAPVAYEYDSMGNPARQTVVLDSASPADAAKNRIQTFQTAWEEREDGVYQTVAATRNNAAGNMLSSAVKRLVTESAVLQNRQITIDERGHESIRWTEYGQGAMRVEKSSVPTSDITASATVVDGFTTSETDNRGIVTAFTRRYTETGIVRTVTDGRGNASTTHTDIAGRPIAVTDAAGNTTTTTYCATSDNPSAVTNALGNTANYAYDIRNRKTAEYGTAIQPALFAWDDANRLISLTTFRIDEETIIPTHPTFPAETLPSGLTMTLPGWNWAKFTPTAGEPSGPTMPTTALPRKRTRAASSLPIHGTRRKAFSQESAFPTARRNRPSPTTSSASSRK